MWTLASVAITPEPTLRRQLGVLAVTALVVGEVIAIGIFLTPAGMAHSLGSPFWLLIVWLVMGVMALSGALCYGELAARAPDAGGGYVYLREAYGPAVAFLYGWKCLLVMDPGITAALSVGLASYVGYALGVAGVSLKLIAIGTILVLAAVNITGVRLGARLMQWLTALKLGKKLWVAAPKYAATAFDLLDAAYAALGRDVLRAVVREHRAHRDRPWLDVLQEDEDAP